MLGLEGWMYDLWEVNPEHLPAILAEVAAPSTTEPAWAGLSVTMPHKQTVLPMLEFFFHVEYVLGDLIWLVELSGVILSSVINFFI